MRTVKQVSDLTGVSVRSLHYYDQIGLLKPTKVTEAGYRLYDDEALRTLQQILFFKELEISLREVKEIIDDPYYDKMQSLKNQKELLIIKRNRLNGLIDLIDRTLKGEGTMSFDEFDMSEYFNVLEEFKREHEDKVIMMYGSVEKFNEHIEVFRKHKDEIAKSAIKEYGSLEKYTKALKKNLNSDMFELSDGFEKFKSDCLGNSNPELSNLFLKITSDLNKDPNSKEIQKIAGEITEKAKDDYEIFRMKDIDSCWYSMVQLYLVYPAWIQKVDNKYGEGSSIFIGTALKIYMADKKPKLELLFEKVTTDLKKDPCSEEIQNIIREIAEEIKKQNKAIDVDAGENYLGYMAEQYLENSNFIKTIDGKYGEGSSKFLGKALKYYSGKKH